MTRNQTMPKRTKALLTAEDLYKYYPIKGGVITHTMGHVKAVDGVSFSVYEGEVLGLVGESGCGKSTVGRQLVGLENPTGGRLFYRGKDTAQMRRGELREIRTKRQMIFQDPFSSLNPRKHIYDILAYPMLYHHISTKKSVAADIRHLLDMVGLPESVLGRYPHEFSGGQRQRIGIARALSLQPEFIVCDEPVSALDVSVQAQILNLLRDLQKELGLTLLFIAHGLDAVYYASDRIAVMYLGMIVEIGAADDVFHHPAHPYTQALLAASPVPDPHVRTQTVLAGEARRAGEVSEGCLFAPRCPYATDACKNKRPALEAISAAHYAACTRLHEEGGAPWASIS